MTNQDEQAPLSDDADNHFLRRRAAWHRACAENAANDSARVVHEQFVSLYLARIRPSE